MNPTIFQSVMTSFDICSDEINRVQNSDDGEYTCVVQQTVEVEPSAETYVDIVQGCGEGDFLFVEEEAATFADWRAVGHGLCLINLCTSFYYKSLASWLLF